MVNRVFIVAMPGAGNLGDDLISSILVAQVLKKWPNAEVGVLHNEEINHFGYPNNRVRLMKKPRLSKSGYRLRTKQLKSFLNSADVFIVGGGGLLQDTHFLFTCHRYLRLIKHLKSSCLKIVTGVGVGPLKAKLTRKYLQIVLKAFDYIEVRDKASATLLRKLGISSTVSTDIVLGSDLSCFSINHGASDSGIGVSLRPWEGLNKNQFVELLVKEAKGINEPIYFFVFEYSLINTSEYDLACYLKSEIEKSGILCEIVTYNLDQHDEFIKKMCSISRAIAVRYHANIIWQKLRIPVYPVGYAPKVHSLYEKYGLTIAEYHSIKNHPLNYVQLELTDTFSLAISRDKKGLRGFSALPLIKFVDIVDFIYKVVFSLKLRLLKKS